MEVGINSNEDIVKQLHFSAVSDEIKFDWVNSYKNFKEKFKVFN